MPLISASYLYLCHWWPCDWNLQLQASTHPYMHTTVGRRTDGRPAGPCDPIDRPFQRYRVPTGTSRIAAAAAAPNPEWGSRYLYGSQWRCNVNATGDVSTSSSAQPGQGVIAGPNKIKGIKKQVLRMQGENTSVVLSLTCRVNSASLIRCVFCNAAFSLALILLRRPCTSRVLSIRTFLLLLAGNDAP